MSGYAKLFSEILMSSIWDANDHTRLVWITMLAMADHTGFVKGTPPVLAALARVPPDRCDAAVVILSSPDLASSTQDNEGRRVEKVAGGWKILNYTKYRNRLSENPVSVAARERQQKHRAKRDGSVTSHAVTVTRSDVGYASASASASVPDPSEGEGGGKEASGAPPEASMVERMPEDGWGWDRVLAVAEWATVAMTEAAAQAYFDARTATGWIDASGRAVAKNLPSLTADMRRWRASEPRYQSGKGGTSATPDNGPTEWRKAREAAASAVWDAKQAGEDVFRAMQVVRDKYRDCPKWDGKDAVSSGIDMAMNNTRKKGAQ